jgi:hypothetical protein
VMEQPSIPPAVVGMLLQANIVLYPVLIRTVGMLDTQHAGRALASVTGGAEFDDARDVQMALQTAQEDSVSSYTLGYYPAEDELDGKFHRLAVNLAGDKARNLEVRYRPGYVASKQEAPAAFSGAPIAALLGNPLDLTAVGLRAAVKPATAPGRYEVNLNVDLHDVHLKRDGVAAEGSLDVGILAEGKVRGRTVRLSMSAKELADSLENGYTIIFSGIRAAEGNVRVVVRDPATGLAGSLTLPLPR